MSSPAPCAAEHPVRAARPDPISKHFVDPCRPDGAMYGRKALEPLVEGPADGCQRTQLSG
jgi:hypothetical protein